MNENSARIKRVMLIVVLFMVVFTFFGATLSSWNWNTNESEYTEVVFTLNNDFSCAADGGGDITSGEVVVMPSPCTDSEHAIMREVTVMPTIEKDNFDVGLELWINVDELGEGLSNSQNFKYALTSSNTSCSSEVVSSGNFNGKTVGDTVKILDKKYSSTTVETYYLWIWLDEVETDVSTTRQSFTLSLGGQCTGGANEPVLDAGMIPVTIADDGTVTTISKNDENWYSYETQQWANVVLVNENATDGVDGSQSRSYYLSNLSNNVTVNQSDILAYYTWIPRYKYKIPYTKCSEIPEEDRNMEDYPECYAPYTMSDTDKTKLVSYFEAEEYCGGTDEYSSSEIAVNYALENGRFTFSEWYDTSIVAYVNAYNNGESNNCGSPDGTTLTLTASEFNGDNVLKNTPTAIDIVFEAPSSAMSTGNATTTYRTHPAFWWDDDSDSVIDSGEMLPGIWVGKFETSTDTSSTCYTSASAANCNNISESPRVLPNVYSLRYQYIGNQFTTSKKFSGSTNLYGLSYETTDSHMMKNSEWGAVAYLSHSIYGINEEVRINNNSKYTTGCGASTANANSSSTCEIAYGGATSYPQSTTGNITGVFDMSGGAWEYVMGNYGNTAHSTYIPTLPDSKYYDVYLSSQFTGMYIGNMALCTLDTCGGHALNETAGWYDDYALFVDSGYGSDYPWFIRGGEDYNGASAGVFASRHRSGYAYASWRSVLVPVVREVPTTYTVTYWNGTTNLGTETYSMAADTQLSSWDSFGATELNSSYGWEFIGWSDDETYNVSYTDGETVLPLTTAGENINLYAVYQRTLTFKSGLSAGTTNGTAIQYWNTHGTTSGTNVSGVTTPSLTLPTSYSNYGWTANGWRQDTTAAGYNYTVGSSKYPSVSKSNTLYGVYKRTVTFKSGLYGSTTTNGTRTQYLNSYGNKVSSIISYALTSITNWTSNGWRNDTTRGSYEYRSGTSYSITPPYNGSSTLYGVYRRTYYIYYNANGGSGTTSSTPVYYAYLNSGHSTTAYVNTTVTMRANGFTHSDADVSFMSWNTASDGSGTSYSAGTSYTYTATIAYNASTFGATLYAIWVEQEYTFTLDPYCEYISSCPDGTEAITVTLKAGDSFTVPNPSNYFSSGYEMQQVGWWYYVSDGGDTADWTSYGDFTWSYVNGDDGVFRNNLTLYAKWEYPDYSSD